MDEIVNNILLAGDEFMTEMHLRQLEFTYSAYGSFSKNEKKVTKGYGYRRLKIYLPKRNRQSLLSTRYRLSVLKIYLEEQVMKKYYKIKPLVLLKIQNITDISVDLLLWFTNFLIKSQLLQILLVVLIRVNLCQTNN